MTERPEREPVIFTAPTVRERTLLFYKILQEQHGSAWEDWSDERFALESLRLNPIFHLHGFHADFAPEHQDSLRLRVIMKVSEIRDVAGQDCSDKEIVEQVQELFPNVVAMDLEFDGLPHLCLVGSWSRLGIRPAPQKRPSTFWGLFTSEP